jgi:SAM-dependent methyltransferase
MKVAETNTNSNQPIFERPAIVAEYAAAAALTPAEVRLLKRYQAEILGKDVLDIGVGAGRTTPFLAGQAASYVGIDFSQRMIDTCQKRFPDWCFRCGDARDLSAYPSASYDFVLFSFNGIDCVDHAGRMQILREVIRVLRPNGVFMFSSHNLDAVGSGNFLRDVFRVSLSADPVRNAKAIARVGLRLMNYLRNARRQYRAAEYALLTDPAHGFTILHYYIAASAQRQQLMKVGFSPSIDVEADTQDRTPYYLYYVARKPRERVG